jgi:hypothetical protein
MATCDVMYILFYWAYGERKEGAQKWIVQYVQREILLKSSAEGGTL